MGLDAAALRGAAEAVATVLAAAINGTVAFGAPVALSGGRVAVSAAVVGASPHLLPPVTATSSDAADARAGASVALVAALIAIAAASPGQGGRPAVTPAESPPGATVLADVVAHAAESADPPPSALLADVVAHAQGAARSAAAPGAGAQLAPPSPRPPPLAHAAAWEPSPHQLASAVAWAVAYTNEERRHGGADGEGLAGGAAAPPLSRVRLRPAVAADAPTVLGFIRELADFEREPDAVVVDEVVYTRDGLRPRGLAAPADLAAAPPLFHAIIAEVETGGEGGDGGGRGGGGGGGGACGHVAVGVALLHASYSTWTGRSVYLEDLYIPPPWRRMGLATLLFRALARTACASRCARLQWSVLAWNDGAVAAYDGMGAARLEDWRLYRLEGDALARVAGWPGGGRSDGGASDAADAGVVGGGTAAEVS